MTAARRILIIRLSSLGDILHTLPAFQSLRDTFPQARIDWLVEKRMSFLLTAVEGIDNVVEVDTRKVKTNAGSREPWGEVLRCIRRLRSEAYDCSLDFQGLLKTALLSLLCGARTRFGFSRTLVREWPAHLFYHRVVPKPDKTTHVVALNQMLAAEAGAARSTRPVELKSIAEDESEVSEQISRAGLREFAVLNPGGGWPTKRWLPSRYGELGSRIFSELGLGIVVTTGPGEEPLFDEIARNCPAARPVHLQLPFLQMIPLIRRAHLFIGGDTGPFHLACALEIPTVCILGPTDPARNGPWREIDESVVRVLPCSFCNGRTCPTQNECMDIGAEQVFQAVLKRMARSG